MFVVALQEQVEGLVNQLRAILADVFFCSATSASKAAARVRLGRHPRNTRIGRGACSGFTDLFFTTTLSFTSFPVAAWLAALVASSLIHSGGTSSSYLVLAIGRRPLLDRERHGR